MAAAAADVDGAAFTALLQLLLLLLPLLLVFSYVFSNQMSEAANRAEPTAAATTINKNKCARRATRRDLQIPFKNIAHG